MLDLAKIFAKIKQVALEVVSLFTRWVGRWSDNIKEKIDTCVSNDSSTQQSAKSQPLLLPLGKSLSKSRRAISNKKARLNRGFFVFRDYSPSLALTISLNN